MSWANCCFRGQFSHGETSKEVNQDVDIERSTTKSKKSARKLNSEGALNASGSKNSAGIPKKAGNKQVYVNGQSAGKWYTSPEGRKVSSYPTCTIFFPQISIIPS